MAVVAGAEKNEDTTGREEVQSFYSSPRHHFRRTVYTIKEDDDEDVSNHLNQKQVTKSRAARNNHAFRGSNSRTSRSSTRSNTTDPVSSSSYDEEENDDDDFIVGDNETVFIYGHDKDGMEEWERILVEGLLLLRDDMSYSMPSWSSSSPPCIPINRIHGSSKWIMPTNNKSAKKSSKGYYDLEQDGYYYCPPKPSESSRKGKGSLATKKNPKSASSKLGGSRHNDNNGHGSHKKSLKGK